MAEAHLKKCSKSLVIKEMQIKMTLKFYLTPIRMAKIKTSGDSTCWQGCGERTTSPFPEALKTTLQINLPVHQKIGNDST